MWNSRSPGVDGAWCRGPSSATNGMQFGGPRTGEQSVPRVGADGGHQRQLLGRVAKADRAHQTREVAERVVHDVLATVVDGGDQKDGCRRQRRQHRLRQRIGHNMDPSVKIADGNAGQDGKMAASPQGLCDFIDASPSPFHVCVTVAAAATRRRATPNCPRGTPGRRTVGRLLHRAGRFAGRLEVRRPTALRSASSAGTPTARTCGSSSTPTGSSPAGRWSRWSRTAGRG